MVPSPRRSADPFRPSGTLAMVHRAAVLMELGCVQVKPGLMNLSQLLVGGNTIVQGAVPAIIAATPRSFYDNLLTVLKVRDVLVGLSLS